MRRIVTILLTLSILFFVSGCAGISYYFQPDIDPNIIWKTEDGSVWFILDGKSNSAGINELRYSVGFNNANGMGFSDFDNWLMLSFSCKFKRNRIIATVRYDENDVIGVGTELVFYKYNISKE